MRNLMLLMEEIVAVCALCLLGLMYLFYVRYPYNRETDSEKGDVREGKVNG